MIFIKEIYQTIRGKYIYINLPDSTYGQWIIRENNSPKYFIDCFSKNESNSIIKHLMDDKNLAITNIIDLLVKHTGKKLCLDKKPLIGIKIDSQKKDINFDSIPIEWLNLSSIQNS